LSPAEAPSRDVDGAVLAAVRDRARALEAAERLFEKQVAGVTLEPDEGELLRYLFPSEFDRARELSRVARLRKFQGQAGSAAEREAARTAHDEAAQKSASEGPRIRQQIETLQAELLALEKSAAEAAALVEKQETALASLDHNVLGEPWRSRYLAAREAYQRDYGRPIANLRARAEGLRTVCSWTPEANPKEIEVHCDHPQLRHIVHAVRQPVSESPWIVRKNPGNPMPQIKIDTAAWQRHVQELQAEAEQAIAEAERLEREGASARAELDAPLANLIPA
jgi:hypothetical protein